MTEPRESSDLSWMIQNLQNTARSIEWLSGELRDHLIVQTRLEASLEEVQGVVSQLTRVLRDGNGGQPILTRLALLEQRVTVGERTGQTSKDWWMKLALNIVTALLLACGSVLAALWLGKKL